MKVNDKKQNITFQKLYAPKDVQALAEFKQSKDFLKSEAQKCDIFVQMIEEADEKTKEPVQKFLIIAKDFYENITGKTKTKTLSSESLNHATTGAVKIMERNKKTTYEQEIFESAQESFGDIFKEFDDILKRFGKKPPNKK